MTTVLDIARWLELRSVKEMSNRIGLSYPVSVRDLIQKVLHEAPKIEHVFVLMLENRSFDHMLGFAGVRGTDITGKPTKATDLIMDPTLLDVARIWEPSVKSVGEIATRLGLNYPVSVRELIAGIHSNKDSSGQTWVANDEATFTISKADGDPRHEFSDVRKQLCGDRDYPLVNNSGFVKSHNSRVMNCFAPDKVPVLVALAGEFALCDRWFSSVPGPTWPNRFFIHAASSGGLVDSPDGSEIATAIFTEGYDFNNGTIFSRLDDRGLSWRVFEGDEFPQSSAIADLDDDNFVDFGQFAAAINDPTFDVAYTFIEPNYGHVLPLSGEDYRGGNSQHPLDDITHGERLIKTIYETIRNSPRWYKSVLLITYDEGGGFFDHVPPPAAVAPGDGMSDAVSEDDDNPGFDFVQLGVRVPAIVISPHIPRGTIDHTVYDHTSLLATVEDLFSLNPLTNRDRHANSFNHLFSLVLPRRDAPTVLPDSAEEVVDWFLSSENSLGMPDDTPISRTVRGFLDIAFRRNYRLAPARLRPALIEEFVRIRTRSEGREYMERVRLKSAPAPLPVVFWSGEYEAVLPLPVGRTLGPLHGVTAGLQSKVPFTCFSTFRDNQGNGLELAFLISPTPEIAKISFPNLRLDQNPTQNSVTGLRLGQGIVTVTAKSAAPGVPIPKFAPYSFPISVTQTKLSS